MSLAAGNAAAARGRAVLAALILALTATCFSPALSERKEFTNWDDPGYVTDQPLVRSLAPENLARMLDPHHDVMLNYHPITMLSLALDYRFAGLDVRRYMATNIALHLLNTLLVLVLVRRLAGGEFIVGAFAALWFGIHPMHVESVAWVPGRKDLLYCLFFLAACITYDGYAQTARRRHFLAALGFFALSCLSKGMAVSLPAVLLLIDYLRRRPFRLRLVVEKIPFLVVALATGWIAARIQAKVPIADFTQFTRAQRLALGAYGFVMYWAKLLVPYRLSAFYPYPLLDEEHRLPTAYTIMPAIALAIVALPLFIASRRGRDPDALRTTVFGVGFFVLTIGMVLQFVSFGTAVMADRYSYLPYVGALLVLATAARAAMDSARGRALALAAVTAYSLLLAVGCYRRVRVWTNSEILWSDVIAKYPFRFADGPEGPKVVARGVTSAYENRGNWYREHGDLERAVRDYEVLVRARVDESGPYVNLANVHGTRGDELLRAGRPEEARAEYARALDLYSQAIARQDNPFESYLDRGLTFAAMGQHERALDDLRAALGLRPDAPGLQTDIAAEELRLGRWADCIADASAAIAATPTDARPYFLRGRSYVRTGKPAEGLANLQRAVVLDPGLGAAWYDLSLLYNQAGDRHAAFDAAERARRAGEPVPDAYLDALARE